MDRRDCRLASDRALDQGCVFKASQAFHVEEVEVHMAVAASGSSPELLGLDRIRPDQQRLNWPRDCRATTT